MIPASKIASGSPLRDASAEEHVTYYIELCETAHHAAITYMEILGNNAIYIDIETYKKLAMLATEFSLEIATILSLLRQAASEQWSSETILDKTEEKRADFVHRFKGKTVPMVQEITNHFRALLGTSG